MARADAGLLLTVAGCFVFLPVFAVMLFAPPAPLNPASGLDALWSYYISNLSSDLPVSLIAHFGELVILVLLLGEGRPTLGEALGLAARRYPVFILVVLLVELAVIGGFVALIVPGVFLLGRLTLAVPSAAALPRAGVGTALNHGLELSRGRALPIAGFVLLVALVLFLMIVTATSLLGALAAAALPAPLALIGQATAEGAGMMVLAILRTLLVAAVYRECERSGT